MEALTILLLCIALALFVISTVYRQDIRLTVLIMVVSVCSIGQVFVDAELSANQVVYVLIPVVTVLIYSAVGMMRLRE